MSFLQITHPKKRDVILEEFFKTKRNFQENFLSERVGESSTQYELSKLFIPVTDSQKLVKESIVSEIKQITEGIKSIPKAITFPKFLSRHMTTMERNLTYILRRYC